MTKILLVEDDKSLREIYGVRLLAEGYDIISAGDGEAALAMAIKDRPQLILSDVMMPKISGFDMLDILRSTTETRGIKVIMMTALSSEDQRARGEQLGADRYLVKSQVGIEDVVRTVHEVLGDAPVSSAQQFTSAPRPATPTAVPPRPAAPAPQPIAAVPQPTPQAPLAPTMVPVTSTPTTQPVAAPPQANPSLPQPTAPFSSPRPGSTTPAGGKTIEPLSANDNGGLGGTSPDLAAQLEQELAADLNLSPQPAPTAPQPPSQPSQAPIPPQPPQF